MPCKLVDIFTLSEFQNIQSNIVENIFYQIQWISNHFLPIFMTQTECYEFDEGWNFIKFSYFNQ